MKIFKLGSNYFSTYEKAEAYRKRYYRSSPYIETIELDPSLDRIIYARCYWRLNQENTEITNLCVYESSHYHESQEKILNRLVIFDKNSMGGPEIRCDIILKRSRDVYKIQKDKVLDKKVKDAFKTWKANGMKERFCIKI